MTSIRPVPARNTDHPRTSDIGVDCFALYEHSGLTLRLYFSGSFLVRVDLGEEAGWTPAKLRQIACPKPLRAQLKAYFSGRPVEFTFPAKFIEGTPFQRQVWKSLRQIPHGTTRSYHWLAAKCGNPRASRAVGAALKKNPIPLFFPCHRVVTADGRLGGFTPGPQIKAILLAIEGVSVRP